jgi:hypothetical protein
MLLHSDYHSSVPGDHSEAPRSREMQVGQLMAGARVLLEDGSVVEVLKATEDGQTVQVRYLEAPFNASMLGKQGTCTDYDIVGYAGQTDMDSAAPPRS